MPLSPSSITILYGSETGNAQDYAFYLARKLRYHSLQPTISSLDDYPLKKLVTDTRILIVICSTTGQGEVPRNGKRFLKFLLKKKLPFDLLNHVQMTSFGVGDSSYPKFNHAIKKLHTRLRQLGCSELCPRCESDEMAPEGVDGYFAEWVSTLIPALCGRFSDLVQIDERVLLPPTMSVRVSEGHTGAFTDRGDADLSLTRAQDPASGLLTGTLTQNTRITAEDHFQDVRHVIIQSDSELVYSPGDTLALYPKNDPQSVQELLDSQSHWIPIADKPLELLGVPALEGGLISREKLTLRTLITYHLDISSIPRRSFFALLFHFVDDRSPDGQREKEKLEEFTRLEECEDLYNYANRPRRSILETIQEFQQNLYIPVEYVLDLFPLIKVRLFSIASRPSPYSVELVVAIVEYKTMLKRIRKGLCTKWLKSACVGEKVVFSIHRANLKWADGWADGTERSISRDLNSLRISDTEGTERTNGGLRPDGPFRPISPSIRPISVLMVAPGTGIAPMKSLIEALAETYNLHLFHGFRDDQKDGLFSDLWAQYQSKGQLSVYNAISRKAGYPYKYVQDRLFAEKNIVLDLILQKRAVVFLCGSSGKMPTQVRLTLVEILRGNVANPEQFLLDMENDGRYIQETW